MIQSRFNLKAKNLNNSVRCVKQPFIPKLWVKLSDLFRNTYHSPLCDGGSRKETDMREKGYWWGNSRARLRKEIRWLTYWVLKGLHRGFKINGKWHFFSFEIINFWDTIKIHRDFKFGFGNCAGERGWRERQGRVGGWWGLFFYASVLLLMIWW